MSARRIRSVLVAACCATVLVVSGCAANGSDPNDSSASTPISSSSASDLGEIVAFDDVAATDVLLTEADLPGYSAVDDSELAAKLGESTATIEQATDVIDVEPAVCEAGLEAQIAAAGQLDAAVEQAAVRVFVTESSILAEGILPAGLVPDVSGVQQFIEQCQQMSISAAGVTGTATITPIEIDLGDNAVAAVVTLQVSTNGQVHQVIAANAAIQDGDVTIALNATDGSGAPAEAVVAVLTDAAAKAHAKAAPILD